MNHSIKIYNNTTSFDLWSTKFNHPSTWQTCSLGTSPWWLWKTVCGQVLGWKFKLYSREQIQRQSMKTSTCCIQWSSSLLDCAQVFPLQPGNTHHYHQNLEISRSTVNKRKATRVLSPEMWSPFQLWGSWSPCSPDLSSWPAGRGPSCWVGSQ